MNGVYGTTTPQFGFLVFLKSETVNQDSNRLKCLQNETWLWYQISVVGLSPILRYAQNAWVI